MKIKMGGSAVSEIIGTILLLAIAVSVFSVVYMNILSDDGPNSKAFVTIVGKLETGDTVFEHQRGDALNLDSTLILRIAGRGEPVTIDNFLDVSAKIDGAWNIGERLIYVLPDEDLMGVQIDATIVNKESSSIVFWGTLQEGYVAPPWGRGGLWHFDELFWDGTPREVKDSSGNENHGTARNGAKIYVEDGDSKTDDIISGNCGYFDGFDDYVEVKSVYSLNITNAVTVEAWVKPLKETSVLSDAIIPLLKFGYNPDLIHIYGDTYAVAARDTGGGGADKPCVVFTFNISSDGTVSTLDPSIPNNRTYLVGLDQLGDKPDIYQHATNDSLYLVAYENATEDSSGAICTLNIAENGSIGDLYNLVFTSSGCYNPTIIHVSGDVYAASYYTGSEKTPGAGILTTINVSSQGQISKISDFTFNSSFCYNPTIIHVSGDVYAIAYQGDSKADPVGVLTTVTISSDGALISKISDFIFNTGFCSHPIFIHVSGDVCAIAYEGPADNGVLTTVNISSGGSSISIIDDFVFASECFEVTITEYVDNKYFLIYSDSGKDDTDTLNKGFLRSVDIEDNGTIVDTAEDWEPESLTGDNDRIYSPSDVLHIGGRVFAFAFRGKDGAHPGHIMCLAMGEDPTPLYERGIVRAGAATLYAQQPKGSEMVNILGCINDENQIISTEVVPDEWYHVVLTYDGSSIKLYIGSLLDDSLPLEPPVEMVYTGSIDIPPTNLLFGNIFYGYIDEIAIFDRALTYDEFNFHHQNPGIFPEV